MRRPSPGAVRSVRDSAHSSLVSRVIAISIVEIADALKLSENVNKTKKERVMRQKMKF